MFRLSRISRSFGATRAVDDVSLEIAPGAVTAIIGENGAGKTTLMRIAAGELAPDSGTVTASGSVALVHQHVMLVNDFSIAENIALATGEPRHTSPASLLRSAAERLAASGIDIPAPHRRVSDLSVGEKSKLELAKAIMRAPSVLILDEPTSVLTPIETEQLFDVARRLTRDGTAVVLISHKLPEVLAIADRIIVMRAGRVVLDQPRTAVDATTLTAAMVESRQAPPSVSHERSALPSEAALVIERLSGEVLDDVSLTLSEGEIGAIVGVAGNGQSELAAAIRGLSRPRSGRILLDRTRVSFVPEDRTRDGIIGEMSVAENLALAANGWAPKRAEETAREAIARFSIRTTGPRQPVRDLSGGNQQKVVLARELARDPRLLVAAEPTRGLDIESSRFVHDRLRGAAASGTAILLLSSDLDEALSLADSIYVIYRGRLSRRLDPAEAPPLLGRLMAGLS